MRDERRTPHGPTGRSLANPSRIWLLALAVFSLWSNTLGEVVARTVVRWFAVIR